MRNKALGRNQGVNNPMYGRKHTNKDKFRKYPNHPAIDYNAFEIDAHGIKRYWMRCLVCDQDKGYRRLDSLNRPCFPCAMKKNKKYTEVQRRIRGATKSRLNSRIRRSRLGRGVGIHFKHLPFNLTELMAHLESLFQEGMSWDNYGEWQIDHIRPESSFNYKCYDDKEFLLCWSLSNLQPLWKIDNLKKGARYEKN